MAEGEALGPERRSARSSASRARCSSPSTTSRTPRRRSCRRPFEEAAILTCDGVGEWATTTQGIGRGDRFELINEIRFPHSLGLLYSAFTYYLGFKVNSAEYKVMGAGAVRKAEVRRRRSSRSSSTCATTARFKLNMKYFAYDYGLTMTNERFAQLFGHPRRDGESKMEEFHWDMAASVQKVTEEIVLRMVRDLHRSTGMKQPVHGGRRGAQLRRERPHRARGTRSSSSGCSRRPATRAARSAPRCSPTTRCSASRAPSAWTTPIWGPAYSDEAIRSYLDARGARYRTLPRDQMIRETARQLNEEQAVIGWFQGRMEWGPRSLGSRSILADARNRENWKRVNLKIKFRESFRPFAPAVLAEKASDWFDIDRESPYMLLVCQVREGREIPAVTHVDGSARIQTVTRESARRVLRPARRIRPPDRLPGDHQHVVQRARRADRLLAGGRLPLLHAHEHGRARARQPDPAQGGAARAGRGRSTGASATSSIEPGPLRRNTGLRRQRRDKEMVMARSTGGFLDRFSIFGELWSFMRVRKKWWLGPIVVTMLLLSVLIVLTEGSAVAPFIYALF